MLVDSMIQSDSDMRNTLLLGFSNTLSSTLEDWTMILPSFMLRGTLILVALMSILLAYPHVTTSLTTSSVTVLGSDAGLPAGGRMNLTVLSSSFNTKWIFHWLIMHRATANLRLPLTSREVVLVTGSI